jgi:hypothetical protein
MRTATLSFHDVSCCLSQNHGRWSWPLVQPCASASPGRTHGLPCSTLADGCLPLKSLDWYQAELEGRALPIGFWVFSSPARGSFVSCRLATQWIASYILLYRTWHLHQGKPLDGDEGVGWKYQHRVVHLSAGRLSAELDGPYAHHLLHANSR